MEPLKEAFETHIKPIIKKWTDKIGAEKIEQFQKISKLLSLIQMASVTTAALAKIYQSSARPGKNLPKRYGKGTWAVITGASDGIGKGFAENLAAKGFNIVLIARNEEKLKAVAADLEQTFKVKTMVLVLDFATCTRFEDYEETLVELNQVDVSLLVNNVGFGNCVRYTSLTYEEIQNLVSINILGQIYFTRYLLPKMLLRKQRSAIINVSSLITGFPRAAYSQMYVATKAFNSMFSLCLSEEYESKLDILDLHPGPVASQLTKRFSTVFGNNLISAAAYSKNVLSTLGYETSTCGTTSFNITYLIMEALSENSTFGNYYNKVSKKALELAENGKFGMTSVHPTS